MGVGVGGGAWDQAYLGHCTEIFPLFDYDTSPYEKFMFYIRVRKGAGHIV